MSKRASLGRSQGAVRERVVRRPIVLHAVSAAGRSVRRRDEAHFDHAREAGQHERVAEQGVHFRREHQGLRVVRHRVSRQDDAFFVRAGERAVVSERKKKKKKEDRLGTTAQEG
jgi:hypothetical protein